MARFPQWVYVAGPYTHPDPVTNTRDAVFAAEVLRENGLLPIVPHLSHLWHLIRPHDIQFWYDYDLELLRRCDRLIRLPGASSGADAEVAFARDTLGIPIHAESTVSATIGACLAGVRSLGGDDG